MLRENTVSTEYTKMTQHTTSSKVPQGNVLNARDLNIKISSKRGKRILLYFVICLSISIVEFI